MLRAAFPVQGPRELLQPNRERSSGEQGSRSPELVWLWGLFWSDAGSVDPQDHVLSPNTLSSSAQLRGRGVRMSLSSVRSMGWVPATISS